MCAGVRVGRHLCHSAATGGSSAVEQRTVKRHHAAILWSGVQISLPGFFLCAMFYGGFAGPKYPRVAHRSPPELRWQSEWLLTTRSSVRSRVEAHFFPLPKPFFVRVFIFLCSGQSARMKTSRSGAGGVRQTAGCFVPKKTAKASAATRDRTGDLQIFSLTLSQLSYSGDGGGHDQYTVALAEQNG